LESKIAFNNIALVCRTAIVKDRQTTSIVAVGAIDEFVSMLLKVT
jgi:hypothetical protein